MPFAGGVEIPIPLSGSLVDWQWMSDPALVAVHEKHLAGDQFTLIDPRTGARRTSFNVPDSLVRAWTALPDDGWAWTEVVSKAFRVQRHGERVPRTFTLPAWYTNVVFLSASADGESVAISGWGPVPIEDTLGVGVLSLRDGKFTRWTSMAGEFGAGSLLPDHSILLALGETLETVTLYRLRGPGQIERLGAIPRPAQRVTVSNDLKRAAVVTRDYHGDAWMYHVARP